MQKSTCKEGCGCTNFKADAFKKEKCCNCFHNHILDGAGAPPPAAKAPAPAPAKKPATAAAGGAKCPECDCTNFQPDAFKKEKCRNCFHSHPSAGGGEVKTAPAPPPAAAEKKADQAAEKAAAAAAESKAAADKAAADKAAAEKAAAAKAAAEKSAAAAPKAQAAPPSAVVSPKPQAAGLVGKNVLKIAWHQSTRSEQYQLDVGDVQNLEQLDARLRKQEVALAGKRFDYLCRGQLVPKVFWDIFRPEHLFPILFIQEDSGDSTARNRPNKAAIGSAPQEKKTGGFVAPSTAAAGFATPSKVTFQKPVVKIAAAPAPAATGQKAKVGFKADDAWFASRPALFC